MLVRIMHERPTHSAEEYLLDARYLPWWPEGYCTVPCWLWAAISRIHGLQAFRYRNDIDVAGYGTYHAAAMYNLLPALRYLLERSANDLQPAIMQAAILPKSAPPATRQTQVSQLQGASMHTQQPLTAGVAFAAPAITLAPPAIVPPPGAQQHSSSQPAVQAALPAAKTSGPAAMPLGHSKQ